MGNIYSKATDLYIWKTREHGSCKLWIQAGSEGQAKEALDFVWYQHTLFGKAGPMGGVADVSHQSTGH